MINYANHIILISLSIYIGEMFLSCVMLLE